MDRRRRVYHHLTFDTWEEADLGYALLKDKQRRAPWIFQDVYWVGEGDDHGIEYHHLAVWMVHAADPRSWEAVRLELADVAKRAGGEYSGGRDMWPDRRPRNRTWPTAHRRRARR